MRLRVLLFVKLGVPFASCFDTVSLGGEFLGPLPEDLARSAHNLGTILEMHPSLHFDVEQKYWSVSEIRQFNEFFPALCGFVELALQHPELIAQDQRLGNTLNHLLMGQITNDDDVFAVVPVSPESALPLALARASFLALRGAYRKFCSTHQTEDKGFKAHTFSPQWPIEVSTFEPAVRIASEARLVFQLIKQLKTRTTNAEATEHLSLVTGSIDALPILTQRLKESTSGLRRSFQSLHMAAEGLAETGCDWSWLHHALELWDPALMVGARSVSQVWERQAMEASQRAIIEEFSQAVNRFRASLLTRTMLLWPTAVEIGTEKTIRGFDVGKVYGELNQWLDNASLSLVPRLKAMEDLVAVQKVEWSPDIFKGRVKELSRWGDLDDWSPKTGSLEFAVGKLITCFPGGVKASDLEQGTVDILKRSHELAKRAVEAQGGLVDLARERLGESAEFDLLLLSTLDQGDSKRLFEHAVYMAKYIERIPGIVDSASLCDLNKAFLYGMFLCFLGTKGALRSISPAEASGGERAADDSEQSDGESLAMHISTERVMGRREVGL